MPENLPGIVYLLRGLSIRRYDSVKPSDITCITTLRNPPDRKFFRWRVAAWECWLQKKLKFFEKKSGFLTLYCKRGVYEGKDFEGRG